MRIDKNTGMPLARQLDAAARDKAKILAQLASGKKINTASDDPAGLAEAVDFEKQIRAFRNAAENIAAGMSSLSIADGGADSINNLLQRQRELAVQSSTATLNSEQRQAIDNEFQSLSQEIERVARSTQLNDQNLLDGSNKLSDGTGAIRGADAGGSIDLPRADLRLNSLNLGAQRVDSQDSAFRAIDAIDSAMQKVNGDRAVQGGTQNRLERALNSMDGQLANLTGGLSSIQDLDFAQASTENMRADIIQESNAAALSQFNNLSREKVMTLLQ